MIKSGEALEKMGNINTIAFDKTGTLTHGSLIVSDIVAYNLDEKELLLLADSAENRSEHPIGKAVIIVSDESVVLGIIALSDTLKKESVQAIAKLAQNGISKTILLTGDNEKTAQHVAKQVGITEVRASLLLEGKVAAVNEMQNKGHLISLHLWL